MTAEAETAREGQLEANPAGFARARRGPGTWSAALGGTIGAAIGGTLVAALTAVAVVIWLEFVSDSCFRMGSCFETHEVAIALALLASPLGLWIGAALGAASALGVRGRRFSWSTFLLVGVIWPLLFVILAVLMLYFVASGVPSSAFSDLGFDIAAWFYLITLAYVIGSLVVSLVAGLLGGWISIRRADWNARRRAAAVPTGTR